MQDDRPDGDLPTGVAVPGPGGVLSVEDLPRGASLGRYLVVQRIGAGGMGTVYSAYDPELNRRLAVKVLRSSNSEAPEQWRRFVLREARAMAALQHQNVVAVHDVGMVEGRVFIAMDFVDGGTLRRWLKERPRSWRDVVEVMAAAGAGLEAAHQAGLLHQDFKPDNVLVSRDGHVFVTDFGLVRSANPEGEEVTSPSSSENTPRPHGPVGTPQYMAPEIFLGGAADARTDQFSFCVALHEALYGQRPFPGDQADEIAQAAIRGSVSPPPGGRWVPSALRQVVLQGLSPAPEDRFRSMSELLARMAAIPRRRRTWVTAAAVVAMVGIPAAVAGVSWRQQQHACLAAETVLSDAWSGGRHDRIQAAFQRTGRPFAGDAWAGVSQALDAYALEWRRAHRAVCQAAAAGQPHALAAEACLDDRLKDFDALARLLMEADGVVVERAVDASHRLPSLSVCMASPAAEVRPTAPPAAEQELRARLAQATLLLHAGKFVDGLKITQTVLASAEAGPQTVKAEALALRGELEERLGQYAEADATLEQAAREADSARDDRVRASALVERVVVNGRLSRSAEAERIASDAAATIARLGGEDSLEARRLTALSRILKYEGRYAEAESMIRQALAIQMRLTGREDGEVAHALSSLGVVLDDLGRDEEAVAAQSEALNIRRHLFGARHPEVADSLMNRGVALRNLDRLTEAAADCQEALAIDEATLGPNSTYVATALAVLASVEIRLGQVDSARAHIQKAIDIRERTMGPDAPPVAMALTDAMNLEAREGHWEQARALAERALQIRRKALGPEHPLVAESLEGLGDALDHLGRTREAVGVLEQAVAQREKAGDRRLGAAQAALAQALWDAGDRGRARALTTAALARAPEGAPERAALERWAAQHAAK